ncbi:MAG TPA: hypothetical protein VF800_26270 [Telluria sp.]|jgi:hypothetical protein
MLQSCAIFDVDTWLYASAGDFFVHCCGLAKSCLFVIIMAGAFAVFIARIAFRVFGQ